VVSCESKELWNLNICGGKSMKNRVLLIFLAVVLVVSLVAFATCKAEEELPIVEEEEEEAPPVEEEEEEVWQWPEKLFIATTGGVGIAAVTGYTSAIYADTGMMIRVAPAPALALRFLWVKEGKSFSTALAQTEMAQCLEGRLGFATRMLGPFQPRMMWAFSVAELGCMVRGDSDLKTIYDIGLGTKLVDFIGQPGYWEVMRSLLAWIGVDEADIVRVPIGSGATRAIVDGRADVLFYWTITPDTYEAAAAPHGIRWLDLNVEEDPEGAKRFQEVLPTASFGVMHQGPPSAHDVWGMVVLAVTLTREETDPELVYHWVKWLDENYDLYKDNHAWNQYMTLENTMKAVGIWFLPVHDGAIKYLKEKGLWTAAHDARQEQNIELITRYIKAYQEAIDMADEQGIMVDPENEEWVELWVNYKEELGLPEFSMFIGIEE